MDTPLDRKCHLFIIRLWLETSQSPNGYELAHLGEKQRQWRGLVKNVATGQHLYFTSLADMSDFISFQLEEK